MTNPILRYRDATVSDAPILRQWDKYDHIIASDPDGEWDWETEIGKIVDWREQWMFLLEDEPLGFVQIIDPEKEESHYWGDIGSGYQAIDIWIGPEKYLGRGYGTQMMKAAVDYCFSKSEVNSVIIDPLVSNVRAIEFYQRLGFRFLENRDFEESRCAIHILNRSDWKLSHDTRAEK